VDSPVPQRVLVYDRISQNRAKITLLVTFAILLLLPLFGLIGLSAYNLLGRLGRYTAPFQAGYQGTASRQMELITKLGEMEEWQLEELSAKYEHLRRAEQRGEISREALRREVTRLLDPEQVKRLEEQERESEKNRILPTLAIVIGVAVCLGIVFRGIVSSPASKALAFCGARPAGPAEIETKRLLENLAIGAGLPPPKLYVINADAPNAFAAGMDPEHSTVAVTTGLLALLDRQEMEGVLAHELSHIGNRDTRLNTTVFAITLLLRLPMLLWQAGGQGRRGRRQPATEVEHGPRFFGIYRWVGLPAYLYIFFVAPFLALLIRAAISRSRESLADADAALLTRYPEGLLRALAKIAGANLLVEGSNPLVSHFYFASPSAAGAVLGIFSGNLLATHPPIRERVTRMVELGAVVPPSVVEAAVKEGEAWGIAHPPRVSLMMVDKPADDELTVLANADSRQRVYRVLGSVPVAVYERDDPTASVVTRLPPGALLVVFDYGNKMRQVLTANQTFGYIPRAAKLERVDMHPNEVFDSAIQAKTQSPPAPQPTAQSQAQQPAVEWRPIALAAVAGAAATPAVQPSPEQAAVAAPLPATPAVAEPRPAAETPPATQPAAESQVRAQPAVEPKPVVEAPTQAEAPASDVRPGLTPALMVAAAFLAILAVGGIVVGIVLLIQELSGR
jgi:heat shock protein HtpX